MDLLILTEEKLAEGTVEDLLNLTYPIYLQCGRQISPAFRTAGSWDNAATDKERPFFERVRREGKLIWAETGPTDDAQP
jgi:hypothetical protein